MGPHYQIASDAPGLLWTTASRSIYRTRFKKF